ncbi:hypothetical protein M758_UG159200 [Ceratodon purpureus]|nr:hypothetical protein M758_UG159200 [Ceratodon purpureus]
MAQTNYLTGSDTSPTFSSSKEESSLYDSTDLWSHRRLYRFIDTPAHTRTAVWEMSTPSGQCSDTFPAKRRHEDDLGPGFAHPPRPMQPMYTDMDEENFDEEFGADLQDGEYDQHGGPGQSVHDPDSFRGVASTHMAWDRCETIGTYRHRSSTLDQRGLRRLPLGYVAAAEAYMHDIVSLSDHNPASRMVSREAYPPQSVVPWRMAEEDPTKRRRIQRQFSKPYLSKMASAHAERRSLVVHVPTTTTGKPIGLRSAWHRQVRLIARQTLDHSVWSYRGKKSA